MNHPKQERQGASAASQLPGNHQPFTTIEPDWPAPPAVAAIATTRFGGVSAPPFDALNLGTACGDDPAAVRINRRRVRDALGLSREPLWLNQVHGADVVHLPPTSRSPDNRVPTADASISTVPGQACAILTADCIPVLLCDLAGTCVAGAHAGWRGLAAEVLIKTCAQMPASADRLMAWLGPGISQPAYEVSDALRTTFARLDPALESCFTAVEDRPGKWLADLFAIARRQLEGAGVGAVYGGQHCTHTDSQRFYSHRREAPTGRQASLIWLREGHPTTAI